MRYCRGSIDMFEKKKKKKKKKKKNSIIAIAPYPNPNYSTGRVNLLLIKSSFQSEPIITATESSVWISSKGSTCVYMNNTEFVGR
jgi:hypothetical protein